MAKKKPESPEFEEVIRTEEGVILRRKRPGPEEGGFTTVTRGKGGSIFRRPEPAGKFEMVARGASGSHARLKR